MSDVRAMARGCINTFFLTLLWNNSIYESHRDFRIANYSIGEPLDEERNQEGSREKEGRSEKEEVILASC
jgi:hypothetical protein